MDFHISAKICTFSYTLINWLSIIPSTIHCVMLTETDTINDDTREAAGLHEHVCVRILFANYRPVLIAGLLGL